NSVQPGKKARWKLKDAVDRQLTSILVGTEHELESIEQDMSFEGRFFSLREHFDIVKLDAPDDQTNFNLVDQHFDRPEICGRGIRFELKEDNGKDPRVQLIHHFINRVDHLSNEMKTDRT